LPLSLDTFPNTSFTASDTEFASPGFRVLNPGDTFGLANVSFTVSPTAELNQTDAITFVSSTTSLSDQNGSAIPFTTTNGTLSTVPEPSALIEAATATLFGAGWFWWRRRRSRATAAGEQQFEQKDAKDTKD
jgi:hypothetical protein